MRDSGLEQAIKAVGGISALARALGLSQPSVSAWSRVPAERVLAVEAIAAVPRHVLRPDLHPTTGGGVDAVDEARGQLYLLLANLLSDIPLAGLLTEIARLPRRDDDLIGSALAALSDAATDVSPDAVAREHFELFVGVGRGELVPYASYYRTGFLYERPLVNVRTDLRILGLERGDGTGEPEDGIGFLCEVMAGMALGRYPVPEGFERSFFARHLAPWAEKVFADLEAADAATFYRAVGRLGRIFMALEREGFALDAANQNADAMHPDYGPEGHHDKKAS